MLRVFILLGVLSAVLTASVAHADETLQPFQKSFRSTHRSVRIVNHDQRLLAFPLRRYHWGAERCATQHCRARIAGRWYQRRVSWNHRLARMRHPSQSSCRAFVARRFGSQASTALYVVNRESHCYWAAQNPTSTAAGVFQFLDSWGTLQQRLDAVWSVNRAYRAVQAVGWSPWRCC